MGMAGDQLVVHPPSHVGQGERPLLGGQLGVEGDLEQQVAQLLLEVGQAHRRPRPARRSRGGNQLVDGLEHLVALLQQVAAQRVVGLLAVPRALDREAWPPARPAAATSPDTGAVSSGTYSEVRWSGSTTRSSSAADTSKMRSSVGAQPLEHHHPAIEGQRRLHPLVQSQLDLRQHVHASRTGPPAADRARPAASTPKRCPSTTRTPWVIGSMPSRAHARSRNDSAGTSSSSRSGSWPALTASSSTVRSATTGEPGTA